MSDFTTSAPAPAAASSGSFTLAPWFSRVAATIVDSIINVPVYLVGLGIGTAIDGGKTGLTLAYVFSTIFGLYQLYLQGSTGSTLGKRALSISVVNESDAQFTGFGKAFVRAILHILDSILLIGYLFPLWDAKKQTFADKIMSTVVIKK